MKNITAFLIFVMSLIILASCERNSEMKSEVKDAISSQINNGDKDVSVKVTKFGEFYAIFWDTKKDDNIVKEKIGANKCDLDVNKSFSIVSGTKEKTGNVQQMRELAIELDKDIKECGVEPICYYTTCNVTFENKVYKKRTEIVYGATITYYDGKTEVDVIPDFSSAREIDF